MRFNYRIRLWNVTNNQEQVYDIDDTTFSGMHHDFSNWIALQKKTFRKDFELIAIEIRD